MPNLVIGQNKKAFFTLLELICVLAISSLVIGVVIGRTSKKPTLISFDNCINSISRVLSEASNQAIINGKKVVIEYNNRQFFPKDNDCFTKKSFNKYITYSIPETLTINFPDAEGGKNISFVFFPDGSASAPTMEIRLKQHSAILKTSKLTGMTKITY